MWESVALVLVVAGTLLWIDSLRAREKAVAAGRAACERYGVQFLDETVAFARLRLARNAAGRLRLQRRYVFEFSDTGNNRRGGSIVVLGAEIDDLQMEPYPLRDGLTDAGSSRPRLH
jgi:Protein of unknown function (DUF3301)